jgi:hypothetical protein
VKDEDVLPPPSRAIHCLTGNLLRALLGFGWLEDERVQRAIDWQARVATGLGVVAFAKVGRRSERKDDPGAADPIHYYATAANGPGFRCAANDKLPFAWGTT